MDNETMGNITTLIKLGVMFFAPYFSIDAATQSNLISFLVAFIFLIVGYFDARYDSTIIPTVNNPSANSDIDVDMEKEY